MSIKKRMREARALARRVLAERNIDLDIRLHMGRHACVILTTRGGRISRRVIFAGTPGCPRWLDHLQKDLRHALADLCAVLSPAIQGSCG